MYLCGCTPPLPQNNEYFFFRIYWISYQIGINARKLSGNGASLYSFRGWVKNDGRKCLNFWISLSIWLLYIVKASFNIYCEQIRSLNTTAMLYIRCFSTYKSSVYVSVRAFFAITSTGVPKQQRFGKDCRFLLLPNATWNEVAIKSLVGIGCVDAVATTTIAVITRKCNVIKNFQNTLKLNQAINLSRGRALHPFAPFHPFLPNTKIIQTIFWIECSHACLFV